MSGTVERLDFDTLEDIFIGLFGGHKHTPEQRAIVDAEWDALQDEVFGPLCTQLPLASINGSE